MLESKQFDSGCPINALMDVISAKWTVEMLRELSLGPTRTRRFLLHIPGLSMKTLCRRLQVLREARLISRHEYPDKALKVEYELTEFGERLCAILEQLKILELEMKQNSLSCKCSFERDCLADPSLFSCPHRRVQRSKEQT